MIEGKTLDPSQKHAGMTGFVGSTRFKPCPSRSTDQPAMYSVIHSFEIIIPDSNARQQESAFKTVDPRFTAGFLPCALRASLRLFKNTPGDFIAGMTKPDNEDDEV